MNACRPIDRTTRIRAALVALLAAGALGCATPGVPGLEEADAALAAAGEHENVARYAPVPFYEAQKTLAKARDMREEGRIEEAEHLAYLARKRVEIARVVADTMVAREQVDRLRGERDEVRLSLRTREAEQARQRAQVAEREARQLIRELEGRRTARGFVLTLDDVPFATDQAELEPGTRAALDRLAAYLLRTDQRVRIEGHTDATGPEAYNEALSRARADAVRTYLVRRGVPPGRVEAIGLGEDYPVASNTSEAGRQRNRRVEIVIEDAPPAVGAGPP